MTPRDGCLLRKVEELSDPGTEQWDVELVTQTFFVEDARLILALAVHAELDDVDLQTKCIENMISSSSGGDENEEAIWKGLWKLKCPSKGETLPVAIGA